MNTINIDGIEYVPKTECMTEVTDNYVIVRGDRSGVSAGHLKEEIGTKITLTHSRRLWYWDGANSVSEIAMKGVQEPQNCKFPCVVPIHTIYDVIEKIPATSEAMESINSVPVWSYESGVVI